MLLSPKKIRELLDYDPVTGLFTWKFRKPIKPGDKYFNTRFGGKSVAPRVHRHGHLQIGIKCKNYMAHRIAWAHFYGRHPNGHIDHKNRNPSDNRIDNLRIATQSQNLMNSSIRSDNTSGAKGVSWQQQSKKWYAYINFKRKMIAIGTYRTFEEAAHARLQKEKQLFAEFSVFSGRGQSP